MAENVRVTHPGRRPSAARVSDRSKPRGSRDAAARKVAKFADVPADPEQRSRVSNNPALLPNIDNRGAISRRFRDVVGALVADQGGISEISEVRIHLLRRFAAAAVIAEQMEAQIADGGTIDIPSHALLCSTLVRVAARIGINRRAKNISKSLADILSAPPPLEVGEPTEPLESDDD